jgi:spore maturation protein CgeB
MRFEKLEEIYKTEIELIDLTPIILDTPKLLRSIGWRYKMGPLITNINSRILKQLATKAHIYDLIWIDKGVFLTKNTLKLLKYKTEKIIHFTPDPAFLFHKSRFFNRSIHYYDSCVTTKSFEIDLYTKKGCKNIIYATQGYDESIHKPFCEFEDKIFDVCFIGHYEKNREIIIQELIDNQISVVLAGIKWEGFVERNRNSEFLNYYGANVSGLSYSKLISQSFIGLGLLSKWIPEKHTTRTFEIPACGTALLTECNNETMSFFLENEVVFYNSENEILKTVKESLKSKDKLKKTSINGMHKVHQGPFSYLKIMQIVVEKINNN